MSARPLKPGDVATRVAHNVRQARRHQGLTQAQLSQLTERSGHRISQVAIATLEAGRRRVDVDDLVALAAALGIEPSDLLLGSMRFSMVRESQDD